MMHMSVLLVLLLGGGAIAEPYPVAYVGKVRLPVDLTTADRIRISEGMTHVEVRRERQHYLLFFLVDGKVVAVINGQRLEEDAELDATVPLGPFKIRVEALLERLREDEIW